MSAAQSCLALSSNIFQKQWNKQTKNDRTNSGKNTERHSRYMKVNIRFSELYQTLIFSLICLALFDHIFWMIFMALWIVNARTKLNYEWKSVQQQQGRGEWFGWTGMWNMIRPIENIWINYYVEHRRLRSEIHYIDQEMMKSEMRKSRLWLKMVSKVTQWNAYTEHITYIYI